MKHLKFLGLLAMAAMTSMALAASASATSVTTTTGGAAATPTLHLVNEWGHVTLANSIANISCASTIEGSISSHGFGVPATGTISTLLFNSCTNSWHVTSWANGTLAISSTGGHNGTVTSTGMQFDATRFGVTCVYQTNNTPIGTITGGNPATLKLEAFLPMNTELSSFLCGGGNPTKAQWEGSYVTTSALYITS